MPLTEGPEALMINFHLFYTYFLLCIEDRFHFHFYWCMKTEKSSVRIWKIMAGEHYHSVGHFWFFTNYPTFFRELKSFSCFCPMLFISIEKPNVLLRFCCVTFWHFALFNWSSLLQSKLSKHQYSQVHQMFFENKYHPFCYSNWKVRFLALDWFFSSGFWVVCLSGFYVSSRSFAAVAVFLIFFGFLNCIWNTLLVDSLPSFITIFSSFHQICDQTTVALQNPCLETFFEVLYCRSHSLLHLDLKER